MGRTPWFVAFLVAWAPLQVLGGCGRIGFDETTTLADTVLDAGADRLARADAMGDAGNADADSPLDGTTPDSAREADSTIGPEANAPDVSPPDGPPAADSADGNSTTDSGAGPDTAVVDSMATDTTQDSSEASAPDTGPQAYPVGGVVMGLSGSGLVLENDGGSALAVGMNGNFTFSSSVFAGQGYDVTILTQPSGQTCTVSAGMGTVGAGPVTSVVVDCVSGSFIVGGTVQGLASGESVELEDNGGDSTFVSQNGAFAFQTPVAIGSPYDVTVLANPGTPVDQACTVTMGRGTIGSGNVSSVLVKCVDQTFTVGGSVTGLTGAATISLLDNGADSLTVTDGSFTFPTPVASGQSYSVTLSSSSGYTCVVGSGSGVVSNANVTGVRIACAQEAIFGFTGSDQSFVVPAGVTSLTVKLWGAAGGSSGAVAGGGGFVTNSALPVTPGESLVVVVGGGGSIQIGANPETYGGGGAGSSQPMYAWTGAGGGRSAIRDPNVGDIITAGGGGGTGYSGQTGAGGNGCGGAAGAGGDASGPAAGQGGQTSSGGAGGSQNASAPGQSGALYQGGDGANQWQNLNVGAGGGGGYYGGGGGGGTDGSQSGAGGGGSCYGPSGTTFDGTGGTTDPDWQENAGRPGSGAGNPGLVVIRW
jgi:hypothetical protein